VTVLLFSTMFSAMIVLPPILSIAPYNLNEGMIGLANGLPFGMGGLLAAPIGGAMADWCARRWSGSPTGRMVFGSVVAATAFPVAVMMFGWGMQYTLPLALPLVGG